MVTERDHVLFGEQPDAALSAMTQELDEQISGLLVSQHGGGPDCAFLAFDPGIELLPYRRIAELALPEPSQKVVDGFSQRRLGRRTRSDLAFGSDVGI